MRDFSLPATNEKAFKILITIIILAGIALRVVIYLQNRNLIIDEANVARNIYERGFMDLAKPLSYEQYAPPVFLWLIKTSTLLFGFSEYALKLYPFISGLTSVYLLYLLLKKLISLRAIWLPLALYATCDFIIRYATELKQYNNDVMIMLLLMLLAFRQNINTDKPVKFIIQWFLAGSLAIWTSMPSVFILAGVGCYYAVEVLKAKTYKRFTPLIILTFLWLLQFLIYYIIILEPQANSKYLQDFHKEYFLYLTPKLFVEWKHNFARIRDLIGVISGPTFMSIGFLSILMLVGFMRFIKQDISKGLLIIIPIIALLFAAAIHQFSLIPRVSLFAIVLFVVIAGYGFDQLINVSGRYIKPILAFCAIFLVGSTVNNTRQTSFKYEELTKGLQYAIHKRITGDFLYLYHSSAPAFIYYTQIHPGKEHWITVKNAEILKWDTDYESLAKGIRYEWDAKGPYGFLFTNEEPFEFNSRVNALQKHLILADKLDKKTVKCVIMVE